jgi:putative glycerol-1-phosphate prenyltransferase
MTSIYQDIVRLSEQNEKLLAVLIDPDKIEIESISSLSKQIQNTHVNYIFVGGSEVEESNTEEVVKELKRHIDLPVILFPGDVSQITNLADGILFLSLISGRNSDYLIDKHVQAVSKLEYSNLEVIPTGYILVENGHETAVQRVSQTEPISVTDINTITNKAKAGELLGMKLVYLEAGSGAKSPVPSDIIRQTKRKLKIPLIVGGGIRSKVQLDDAYNAGADLVVIGTAFENDENFFNSIK